MRNTSPEDREISRGQSRGLRGVKSPQEGNLKVFALSRDVLDSIAVSEYVLIFVGLDKSETNPNSNLMMRRAGLSRLYIQRGVMSPISW